jgi:hypothetical protein
VAGETLRVNSSSSVTYVTEGAVDNIFYDVSIIDASGVDRYDNYHIQYYEYGKLIITPRMLSVYSGSAEKLFDHTPLVEPECGLMIGEGYGTLVEGHTITVVATGSQTVPGVSINTVKCSIADSNGNDMTENYYFNGEHLGTLSVWGRSVKVMLASWTKEYNGSEWRMTTNDCRARSDSNVIVEILDLNISRKNVGAVTLEDINITPERYVTLKAYMYIDGSLVEITQWCSIEFYCSQNNVLEVTPKSITLTADSVTIKYDENSPGLSAEPDGFAVTVGPIVAGHTVNAYVLGEVLGSPNNSVTAECRIDEDSVMIIDENGDDVTSNYVIELKPGILEIVPEEKEE